MKTNYILILGASVLVYASSVYQAAATPVPPPAPTSTSGMIDLTLNSSTTPVSVSADYGPDGLVVNSFSHPTGTGVFKPFLTIDSHGNTSIEAGYNTDGFTGMYMDQLRPQWNNLLKVGDLAKLTIDNVEYFAFELDSNEPDPDNKKLISIDNIRIYTSGEDNTANVGSDQTKLDDLGTLRWAMNNELLNPDGTYNIDPWIKLDSTQGDSNGGQGTADMRLYVPVSAFGNAEATDYVWFYNLNGVHFSADSSLGAQAGYEEWRALVGPTSVPDGGMTAAMLGLGLLGVGLFGRRFTVRA